jgi:hypothetical protein
MRLVDETVRKRAAAECRYFVVDDDGRIALADVALPGQLRNIGTLNDAPADRAQANVGFGSK